jgi:two-component system chemotaxis response regulator CheY
MLKIMIVDDAQFLRLRIANFLIKQGYQILEAEDGEQAVETYRLAHPDAVLMDITMPRKDGLRALADIRKLDPCAKVIMLSALGQQSMILEAMKAGASDFLVKPYKSEQIMKVLQKALA